MESKQSDGDRQPEYKKKYNNRGSRGQNNRNASNTDKFNGLNKDELEGIVICESVPTPTAQQFDRLYEALIIYSGARNAKVRKSLNEMRMLNKESFDPPLPSKDSYTSSDGKVDTEVKALRMEVWKDNCKDTFKTYNKYQQAMENLFAVIMGQLGTNIIATLNATKEWKEANQKSDTIALIRILKEVCYRDNSSKVDEGIDLINKLTKFLTSRQGDKDVYTYVEEVTNRWDVFRAAGGVINSPRFMKYVLKSNPVEGKTHTYADYLKLKKSGASEDEATVKQIEDMVGQVLCARIIIHGSTDKHHQAIRLELQRDFAKGHHNYPNNTVDAQALLIQYRVKNNSNQNKQQTTNNNHNRNRNQGKTESKEGNSSANNTRKSSEVTAEKAHNMLMRSLDRDEDSDEDFMFFNWGIESPVSTTGNTHDTYLNEELSDNVSMSTEKLRSEAVSECIHMDKAFLFAQHNGGAVDPNWLLLDSQASCNIICNPDLVKNIRKHPDGTHVRVHCNAGTMVIDTVADLPGLGMVWFDRSCIANCLSLARVSDLFRVTLDTAVTQGIFVHRPDGSSRRFDRTDCNLYVCDLNKEEEFMLVTTVKGRKEFYSDLDIRRAEKARKLQETMGYPSLKAFLHMIDNNTIKNCPITRRDVMMAKDIYGVNVNIVKGKTVRKQPQHVREDILPVPPAILTRYGELTIAIDIYHINGVRFFRSIARHLMFRVTQPIADAKAGTLYKQVRRTVARYASRGFKVKQIYGDNEFNCIADKLLDTDNITFHPVARGAHEPYIERDNRVSKERCRCIFNGLPFKKMPLRMIMELPVAVDYWLNYWCSSGGVSKTMPPRQLITGIALDAAKHCRFQYGDYVLAHNETDNTMNPRAADAIYLRPTGTPDGAFYVFDLKTARRVRKHSATLAHMTDGVIDRVHEIADKQEVPIGLTFGDIHNNVTILDLDTEAIAAEDDDDDASDASFVPDDLSVETELTGVVDDRDDEVSVRSGKGYSADNDDASQSGPGNMDENYHSQDGHVDTATESGGEVENPVREDDVEVTDDAVANDDSGSHHEEEITIEFHPDDGDNEEEAINIVHPTIDIPERRTGLRESVRRTHPKFGVSDGFSETVHHRSLFSKGYGAALRSISGAHDRIVLVSQAVENYNNLDASLATPQYGVKKGLELFGEQGAEAILKELKQLHDLSVVTPVHPRNMTKDEIKKALPYLMFLKRKRCGKIKGRGCADGRPQRDFISREEASSPTASLYAIMLTCLVDAIEERFVATTDIPGAFLQTDMPKDETVHIRITGAMAELMAELDKDLYNQCMVSSKRGTKVIYAKANKAIYGTLRAALLFWQKLKGKLSDWGFKENPYDACTMNKDIDGEQATIVWHVDDLKISHKKEGVVRGIIDDLNKEFGKVSPLTTTYGSSHDYLGMTIDYSTKGKVRFTMFDYLQEILENMPDGLRTNRGAATPAADHLFNTQDNATVLDKERAEIFHSYTAKLLFAAKRARPDIQTAIAYLCTRVKCPNEHDWKKLQRVLAYIKDTVFLPLTIGWDGTGNMHWYVDASFAVHNNMRSHTGAVITFGIGAAMSMSTKQKINTKSSTEAELVGVDDSLPFNIWCLYFLREQGCSIGQSPNPQEAQSFKFLGDKNILYQDNTSSIRLETNGKASSTKRTRHINIRYFLVTDKIQQGEISTVEYCPTEEMIANYFTKPLQGGQFKRFRNQIMGLSESEFTEYKMAYEAALKERRMGRGVDIDEMSRPAEMK